MTERIITGIGVSDGIRIGKAFKLVQDLQLELFGDIAEGDVQSEIERFRAAREKCDLKMDELIEKARLTLGEEKSVVMKGQKSFLSDPAFCPQMEKMISKKFLSAEKAVNKIVEQFAGLFEKMPNDYMKERAADVRDVGKQLLIALTGVETAKIGDIHEEVILFAEDLAPSDTIQLNKEYVLAFITKRGGKTSHTAIFSRSLGIPAIVGIGDAADSIYNGDVIIIDGTEGKCIINPTPDTIVKYRKKMDLEQQEQSRLKEYAGKSAVTLDGHKVEIAANIGANADAVFALEQGAEGVGLLRTELLFMSQTSLPDENQQFEFYKEILQSMQGKPVIIRTLDIGGDKEVPYLKIPKEMNPFLGYRAIRLCLDQKQLLYTQLRAILRASAYGSAKIMFPMISSMEEWMKAKEILEEVKQQLTEENVAFDHAVKVGMMIEVPSAAIMAGQFAKEVDFFSIGTNDLVQYTLAVDRMNEKIAHLYDHFNPAVISLIHHVTQAAHAEGKWVGMCGGMAGDPMAVPLLLAMGLDELSMSATSIQKIKYSINHVKMDKCKILLNDILKMKTIGEIRSALEAFQQQYVQI